MSERDTTRRWPAPWANLPELSEAHGGFAFEAPAWWDPKARDAIYRPRAFEPCLVLVEEPAVLVASQQEVVAAGEIARATLGWPHFGDLPVCDLHLDGVTCRLWFCHPHPRAPMFQSATIRSIDTVVGDRAPGGHVGATRLSAQRLPAWSQLHVGKKRLDRLVELVGSPPTG